MSKENSSFEVKLQKSKEILESLMHPDITLQNSVKAYEEGMNELQEAQKMLEEATLKIKEIKGA